MNVHDLEMKRNDPNFKGPYLITFSEDSKGIEFLSFLRNCEPTFVTFKNWMLVHGLVTVSSWCYTQGCIMVTMMNFEKLLEQDLFKDFIEQGSIQEISPKCPLSIR
jgi:hypothetical protein